MSREVETAASALAVCRAAEAKIGAVQELLRNPAVDALDRAMTELADVVAALNALVASAGRAEAGKWGPAEHASFQEIRRVARGLQAQIEHASKFCLGWIQIRLGTGYTRQGFPVFVESEARSSFEG